ncbi:sulfotransferase family 2 domain-containing protein [Paracoccus suum]|nr:sulfotransferase family 2 domain-containing protein [Paracoccus suum]
MAIIVDKYKLAYLPVPKIACTSLKEVFYRIENDHDFVPAVRNSGMFHIHHFYPTPPFRTVPRWRMKEHYRFCVVRDPIKRLLSCYSNRVRHHRELAARHLSAEAVAAGAIADPDLETFVERLEVYRKHSGQILHHSDPQVVFLGPDVGYFSRVFQMNELDQLTAELRERTGLALELPHSQSGGPKLSPGDLSVAARDKLLRFYRADYDAYSFS